MPRVCIHEVVTVDGTRLADYQQHMTANWVPEAGPLRRQRCFGVFTLVGSTGEWPRVVNLWEYDSWDDLAHNFAVELDQPGHRDPMLAEWWDAAAEFRSGGADRILVAHDDSPGVEYWQSRGGTGAVAYVHEVLTGAPGSASALCGAVMGDGAAAAIEHGLVLVGAWRVAMGADDEVIALWGVPNWRTWAAFEEAVDAGGGFTPEGLRARRRSLLVDAELSPLRIGRQPEERDRRSLRG